MAFVDPASITPTLDQVASHIRTRTLDDNGVQVGTFNADTQPTGDEAGIHVARAARYVALQMGTPLTQWTGSLSDSAKDVVSIYAALAIEQSFYGSGSNPDTTGVDQLGRMFREQLAALIQTAQNNQPGVDRWTTIVQVGPDQVV